MERVGDSCASPPSSGMLVDSLWPVSAALTGCREDNSRVLPTGFAVTKRCGTAFCLAEVVGGINYS